MQPQSSPSPVPMPPADTHQPAVPTMSAVGMPPVATTAPAQSPAPAAPNPAAPAMADDGDLIEKEWVSKVKQIMHTTAHDPYEQNRQFTKLKADYMQKRYGKSIKLDE